MSAIASPFQLLEINLISAQDLAPVSKSMRAYAVAWLHPERKLTTRIDQAGHTNPTWNEKFVFRVNDEFLNSENSVIMIEIYASAWLRDVLIGTVGVLVSNLLPASARTGTRKPKLRFVALQVRRPSGRPQGILNIGVTVLDSTMRSMPIYSELSSSAVGYWDLMDSEKKNKPNQTPGKEYHHDDAPIDSMLLSLQRCQSEKNDSTINDYTYTGGKQGSVYGGSEIGVQNLPPKGGIVNANGSLCSDVGPSPSVVAAAIAKGLYPMPALPGTAASSAIDDWSENNSTEGMKTKMERWRNELTPVYDPGKEFKLKQTPRPNFQTTRRRPRRRRVSCFGTAFGCEFSISCGGGNRKKKHGGSKALTASEITYDESFL